MMRHILIACTLVLAACSSSGTATTSTGARTIGELRAACQQGDRASCNAVQAHDGLL